MAEEEKSRTASIAKVVAWPVVAIAALLILRPFIGAIFPDLETVSVGPVSIKKRSQLGQRASPEVLNALKGLSQGSIAALIARSTPVVCFAALDPAVTRQEHAQLLQRGLIEELQPSEFPSSCPLVQNPVIGLRRTPIGEKAREFQLGLLSQFSETSESPRDSVKR